MAFEGASTRSLLIIFGALAGGAALFLATAVFPATNLIRETIIEEGIIRSSSKSECVVETSDQIPKIIKNCDLPEGSRVTVSFQEGMYEQRSFHSHNKS